MKTNDLIDALAADLGARQPASPRAIGKALVVGGLVSAAVFVPTLGVRPDLENALMTWPFQAKLVIVLMALILAAHDCLRLSAPTTTSFASRLSFILPVLLATAVGVELASASIETWTPRLVGTNAFICLTAIPALAFAPLAAGMYAMKSGAPASPAIAGAAIGRLAAASAGGLYALHCFDDSPLFVATWYSLATLAVMAIGAFVGHRALRW